MNGVFNVPEPKNEPILSYKPGSSERAELQKKLDLMLNEEEAIPAIIGGKRVWTDSLGQCVCPHDFNHVLGQYVKIEEPEIIYRTIDEALAVREKWASTPWEDRAAIFLKAADLLAGPYRQTLNAATMLGQSKTVFQAEIDAVCELVDFWRFNVHYMRQIYEQQPNSSAGCWNRLEWRPLEGFVYAITPFNFTSIAGNLPTAPAMMGNVVLWKPASTAMYSAHYIMELLMEAGLPDGVINMIPGSGERISKTVLQNGHLAGVHFTGSGEAFNSIWQTVGLNLPYYNTYPTLVGETGGKDFIFVHNSADAGAVATAIVRGAFEYQGQKCSAASRAYIPESRWQEISKRVVRSVKEITNLQGSPTEFENFMSAVIDETAYDRITDYIEFTRESGDASVLVGGGASKHSGWYVLPTVIVTKNPHFKTMEDEIFGPVITIYVYPDNTYEKTLELCNETSIYGLTGCIMAKDRDAISLALNKLRNAAGNFYINDKPTGAVVGQQPFGGSRASGTNDKAGSMLNLLRWVSPRTIKETFVPPTDYRYPHMET